MKPMTIREIAAAVGNTDPIFAENKTKILSISTDSRPQIDDSDPAACLFVALRGETFDGHQYVGQALRMKAAYALVDQKGLPEGSFPEELRPKLIFCQDTEQGFLDLAGWYRDQFHPKIVGITGSVGKTTTKEMIAQVLSARFDTVKTQGNFNNRVGLPKTLFNLDDHTEAAVVEMGMSSFGEISDLTRRAKPDLAVITNIGVCHIEFLGSREGILKAKLEILEGMKPGSPLILCGDDELLQQVHDDRFQIITYGLKNSESMIRGTQLEEYEGNTNFIILAEGQRYPVKLPTFGAHNVLNALAAFAAGRSFGMEPQEIVTALAAYRPSGMRQRVVEMDQIRVVEDCYNAGPDSMAAAIRAFGTMQRNAKFPGKKIFVMGDMLELGELSEQAHYDAGCQAAQEDIDVICCYGTLSEESSRAARETLDEDSDKVVWYFTEKEELAKGLLEMLHPGDTIWLKASRGMKLEEVISRLYERFQ